MAVIAAVALAAPARAPAQATADPAARVSPVIVVGATPLGGEVVDIDKLPANVQTLSAEDVASGGTPSLTGALDAQLASVSINDNLDDPFQPDILYRGFEASPVLGTPQGLAVYQDGVRINEAFGDAVNWDLIPTIAIRRVEVRGPDPVFGLNALGGAISLTMKNGFDDQGAAATLLGGSFGLREISAQMGGRDGPVGAFLAANLLSSDGWRAFSADQVREVYGDVGVRGDRLSVDLSFTGASNRLDGEGATPIQELAVDRALVFTGPQSTVESLAFVGLHAAFKATATVSVQGNLYYRDFRQSVINGDATGYVPCAKTAAAGLLCQADGQTPLTDAAGADVPDPSSGGAIPIGENDREWIHSRSEGGSVQIESTAPLLGRENHLAVGASVDRASTGFISDTELGVIDPALQVLAAPPIVVTPEGSAFTATPVSLSASSTYAGAYATDTFSPTARLAVTVSGRYNLALIDLADRLGQALDGHGRYARFNPAAGLTYKIAPALTAYAGYAEGNRAPSPSEIECSNPLMPCLLPSSLASDPPRLKQVVSHTWEAGLRGVLGAPGGGHPAISWNADLFQTRVEDDIYGVATSLSAGYFQNIGATRRQGAELAARYTSRRLTAYASYSFVDGTFRSALMLDSPSNPFADGAGDIFVRRGDRLPGIPRGRLKAGADVRLSKRWGAGGGLRWVTGQYYRGDESNQLAPLPGYAVLDLHSSFDLSRRAQMFVAVDNALDTHYATFGVLGDPTGVGAPGVPDGSAADPRFQSPAAPISIRGGLRVTF